MWRVLIVAVLLWPLAAGAGEETRQVDGLDVNQVVVMGPVEAELSQGEPTLLLIRGSASDLEPAPFFVEGKTLVLGRSADRGARNVDYSDVKFKLTLPALQALELKGSGDVFVRPMTVDSLAVALNGSGDMKLFELKGGSVSLTMGGSGDIQLAGVEADTLDVTLSGSGDIALGSVTVQRLTASLSGSGDISAEKQGRTEELTVNMVGSGDVDLGAVDAARISVNIVGSGDAQVGRSDKIDVNIMGSGDVHYRGKPEISQTIIGSGDLSGD